MRRIEKDNRGIALITVVIGVMFCLLLTSTMLRVSLLGLQSREVNKQTADNFYDAESVIDTVRLNLQNYAAKAWAETTNGADSENFVKRAYYLITGDNYPSSGSLTPSDMTTTIDNLQANAINGGTILSVGDIEAVVGASGKLEGITIKDVEVKYEHPTTKMVSYVKTDITISAPLYASKKKQPLASYSMFAGTGACIYMQSEQEGNANQAGYLEQEGNVYFGYQKWNNASDADALLLARAETMILSGDNIVINGNVIIQQNSCLQITGSDVEIRGKIMIGSKSHLIIGSNTNLHCQDIRFYNSDNFYDYDIGNVSFTLKGVKGGATYKSVARGNAEHAGSAISDNKYKVTKVTQNGSELVPGLPYDWYNISKTSNPYYSGAASIVVVKMKEGTTGHWAAEQLGDAIISSSGITAPTGMTIAGGNNLKREGHISIAMNSQEQVVDTELNPIPRTNKFKNSDGNIITLSKDYDYYFLEMVDGEYFEKFCNECFNTTRNSKADYVVTGDYKCSQAIKNGKYRWKDDNGAYNKLDPGSNIQNRSGNGDGGKRQVTYNGVAGNPTFNVMFTSVGTAVENPVNIGNHPFMLTCDPVVVNMDAAGANYCGVVISSDTVRFKKDGGYCTGKSLLLLDTTTNKTHLKAFMDEVGSIVAGNSGTLTKYMIYNNLFNGGVDRFCDTNNTSGGSGYIADTEHNGELDLIGTSNYEKR